MPVMLVDDKDQLLRIYDESSEEFIDLYDPTGNPTSVEIYDAQGKPVPRLDAHGHPIPVAVFDNRGKRIPLYDKKVRRIPTLKVFKIESNPGAGLWRPHNDQLPLCRKGEGVFTLFRCLGERAALYRDKLSELSKSRRTSA